MDADTREPTTLETAWPLFGLRLRSEHLVLRLPTDDDLPAFVDLGKAGIHPPDEMPFGVAWSAQPLAHARDVDPRGLDAEPHG